MFIFETGMILYQSLKMRQRLNAMTRAYQTMHSDFEKYKEKVLAGFKIEKHSLDKMKKFHRDDAKRINPFNYIK